MHAGDVVSSYLGGRAPLWRAFWLWGVLLSWILFALFLLAVHRLGLTWGLFLVSGAVMLPYTVCVLASVWQCAYNCGNPFWGLAARGLTLVWALSVGLVGGYLAMRLLLY